jgi:hypothetical protein
MEGFLSVPIVWCFDHSTKHVAITQSCDLIVPDRGVVPVSMTIFGA